jgi:hypothetical protein
MSILICIWISLESNRAEANKVLEIDALPKYPHSWTQINYNIYIKMSL